MKFLRGLLSVLGVLVVIAAISFWMRPLNYFDEFAYLQEIFAGVQNNTVMVDGYRMHYEAEGPPTGQPVVLVHGLGGRAEDWRALAPYLARAGLRVYMPDLIGYGRSAQPKNFSYSIPDEAAVLVDFLNDLNLKRVDLGGWSMGGWVVQVVAATHPERVKRLMLFDSAGLYVVPRWNTNVFTPTTVEQLGQLNSLLSPHPPQIPGFVANDILRVSEKGGWVITRAMAQMLTGRAVTDRLLPRLKMPVLLEWGAEDRVIPVDQAEKMHRLVPQSELDVYAGCGHLAPLTCTGAMSPKVVKFLERTPAYEYVPPSARPETASRSRSAGAGSAFDSARTARAGGRQSMIAGVMNKPSSMVK